MDMGVEVLVNGDGRKEEVLDSGVSGHGSCRRITGQWTIVVEALDNGHGSSTTSTSNSSAVVVVAVLQWTD